MTFTATIMKIDTPNLNNRVYTKDAAETAIQKIQGPMRGMIGMPNSTLEIDLDKVSHTCDDFRLNDDGSVSCSVTILDTPQGKLLHDLVNVPGTGFRSAGTALMQQADGVYEIKDFTFLSVNFVNNPA